MYHISFPGEFVAAVETGDYELVKRAFKGDGTYNLESPDMLGKTLLMKAAERGRGYCQNLNYADHLKIVIASL